MFDMLTSPYTHPLKKLIWMRLKAGARAVWETITGNPVSFTAKAAPLRQLEVAFSPVQEGTGDPSPDNVRPISGWNSLNVWHTGQNMFNIAELLNATGWTETDGVYSGTSKNLYATFKLSSGGFIQFPQGASERIRVYYYCHATSEGTRFGIEFSYTDGTTSNYRPTTTTEDTWYTAISTSGKTVDAVGFYYGSSGNVHVSKFGIFVYDADKTAEDYNYAYNPSSRPISITLGQTVYSGTVDVVTGVVTVTHQLFTFGADDVDNWVQGAASIHHFSRRRPSAFTQTTDAAWALKYYSNFLGNPQRSTSASNIKDNGFYAGSSYLIARADSIADIDAFKAYITTTPLQIAVPIWGEQPTIQLTPQEVSSLLGENNMWSDANGNLTVTYAADPATLPIVGKGKVGQAIIGG